MVEESANKRPFKGNSCICFPATYCVVDVETTGVILQQDHIIEIGAIRYVDGSETDRYQTLVQPPLNSRGCFVDESIVDKTGITNEMLSNAPTIEKVLDDFARLIGDDTIVGWNVGFDINFLYDAYAQYLKRPMSNNFVDALRMARKLLKDVDSYTLGNVAARCSIESSQAHRALADVITAQECFLRLKEDALAQYSSEEAFAREFRNGSSSRSAAKRKSMDSLIIDPSKVDEDNPFYRQKCLATGTLNRMSRKEFEDNIIALGGEFQKGLTKETNYLILADNIARQAAEEGKKTKKQIKAETYQDRGLPIEILSEQTFYGRIEKYCY